jgi:AcrR family transcriptional regulator
MDRTALSTEDRIINAARETFLKFGFHGTKLQQVAESAKVNKSVIHYYFRTKEKLYNTILREIILLIESTDWTDARTRDVNSNMKWFIYTEMYNNRNLFENVAKELYPSNWREKLKHIKNFLTIESAFS